MFEAALISSCSLLPIDNVILVPFESHFDIHFCIAFLSEFLTSCLRLHCICFWICFYFCYCFYICILMLLVFVLAGLFWFHLQLYYHFVFIFSICVCSSRNIVWLANIIWNVHCRASAVFYIFKRSHSNTPSHKWSHPKTKITLHWWSS